MTISQAQQQLLLQLNDIYDLNEASTITDWVMEYLTGWKKVDRILNKMVELSEPKKDLLGKVTAELLKSKPIQYILNEAWFCGLRFYVDENVLIPRPETEELVEWLVEEVRSSEFGVRSRESGSGDLNILDIGTGSGCIPIALKKKLPFANLYSCDVSEKALDVAKKNAVTYDTLVHFKNIDFLDKKQWKNLPPIHFIVSNPPYVLQKDKHQLRKNVLEFEPPIALFVNNEDPLIFYSAIADFAREKLHSIGALFVEMNEELAKRVKDNYISKGFATEVKKDMQGKERMLKAWLAG